MTSARGGTAIKRVWLKGQLATGARIIVAEVTDYEVRRELLRLGNLRAVQDLD